MALTAEQLAALHEALGLSPSQQQPPAPAQAARVSSQPPASAPTSPAPAPAGMTTEQLQAVSSAVSSAVTAALAADPRRQLGASPAPHRPPITGGPAPGGVGPEAINDPYNLTEDDAQALVRQHGGYHGAGEAIMAAIRKAPRRRLSVRSRR